MVCFHHCRKNGSCRAPENCCHMCVSYVQPLETHCRVNNSIYQDGDQLPSSPCMTCTCRTGKTKCQRFKCPTRKVCPHGQHLEQTQLECCPKCVNKPGVCTVFGDPHYRTFDGKTFNFQGPCRYTLVRDCTRAELFSVIVQNDARNTHYFAWTKAVELWLGPTTIELLPRLRLRFNGSHAVLPLVTPSLNITTSGFLLKVSTSIGLTVTWDGKSYAEVAITSMWRSRVCGLCGNYNGHYRDELLGQNGYFHADVESFAESWRVDDNEVCARPTRSRLPNVCTGSGKKRRRARRLCRKLISWGFHKCHAIVDLLPFYKSCMMDMCECPKKQRCYCEAFLAYTRACEREGVRIRWDVKQRCHGWL
uniref:BMP-binding endothelial regulator protein n=1 Tax=Eptatretus burgeri TaxID=7764 RepID=A0A8C4QZ18_EPTBU